MLQIVQLLRSLSLHQVNLTLLGCNRTHWRFLIIGGNVHWSNIYTQAMETGENLAREFERLNSATDDLSRNLLAKLCQLKFTCWVPAF